MTNLWLLDNNDKKATTPVEHILCNASDIEGF